MSETDRQWEVAVQHRELSSVFCDALRGGIRSRVGGRSKKERIYIYIYMYILSLSSLYIYIHIYTHIYIHIADSLCCTAETNTTL